MIKVQAQNASIDVVIATYNGRLYIQEQIASIQSCEGYQAYVKRLIVVDDGSSDETIELVSSLMDADDKIELHLNKAAALGPMRNFERGIALATAEWVMLSDQDDTWVSDKIERQLSACMASQQQHGFDTPILSFSDKRIVGSNQQLISASFFDYWAMPKNWHHKAQQLALINVASGCTMMFNQALIQRALPIASEAYMHDWWLALNAKQFGQLIFIEQPLVNYRLHGSNTLGTTHRSLASQLVNLSVIFQEHYQQIYNAAKQAYGFTSSNNLTALPHFASLEQFYQTNSSVKKIWLAAKGQVSKPSIRSRVKTLISVIYTCLYLKCAAQGAKKITVKDHHAD